MQSNLARLPAIFVSINLKYNVGFFIPQIVIINAKEPKMFCDMQNDNLEDINFKLL